MDKLEGIVRDVLEQQFRGVVFDSVEIRGGMDHDDDGVLYVRVVFRSDTPLDVNARVGFVRHLRPHLRRLQEDRFPIMSFISGDDSSEIEALNALTHRDGLRGWPVARPTNPAKPTCAVQSVQHTTPCFTV
ncbi:hypothetical protein [Candidatus Palauibacter sp.]|uniref:hypothetical protein n=1 Tax=Candidatus Palauibacter sp. TaxID=3101350 RepID=UPI003C6F0969